MSRPARYHAPAVVVGAGLNGLGVVRSLGRAGVPVTVVDTRADAPAMRSRYARGYRYPASEPGALLAALERLARAAVGERAVLILTQEEAVAALAVHRSRLERAYRLTMPHADIVERLLHKDGFHSLAQAAGARVPQTRRLCDAEQLAALEALRLPWVIKPAARNADYTKAFAKAYQVANREQAYALLRRMLVVFPDVIVQEWIAGDDSDLYFCLAHIPADGRAPTTFVGRKIRSWPPRVGGTASCAPAPEAAGLARVTLDFFAQAGVVGLASMEYKYDAASGDYLMIEPTVGRTDYQEEIATLNGVNIPLAAYRDAFGLAGPAVTPTPTPRVWRDRVSDRRAVAADAAAGAPMPARARIVDALWRRHDPMPAVVPLYGRVRSRLARLAGGARAANSGGAAL